MKNLSKRRPVPEKEILFQVLLHVVVFIFYAFDRRDNAIELHEILFFINYAIAALFINYLLLPKLFYPKKYLRFFGIVLITITAVLLLEEMVIEKILFPDTRGRTFGGVFFTLLNILPVLTILIGFKFGWDVLRKQREVDELKTMMKESELQFLKSQINPHFLFNNLNNLYAYAVEKSPKTPEIILELSSVLRYMLYDCREKYVSLEKEITNLESFAALSELQIENRGNVSFNADKVQSSYQIAPLILIVFIENAFKHSIASMAKGISIAIDISLSEKGELSFLCKNTFQPQSNTDNLSNGIGLDNVKKRLELIYPNGHNLQISDDGSLYQVNLSIQLEKTA